MTDNTEEKENRFVWNSDLDFKISQCAYCKHKGNGKYCDAFDEIPSDILRNKIDHRKPIKGDKGIQFEPNPGVKPERLDRLFD